MSFISYAKNSEDVILNRSFKEIKNGFYVDIGPSDPVINSVTKSFYDSGWRGINADLPIDSVDLFSLHRARDVNLYRPALDGNVEATSLNNGILEYTQGNPIHFLKIHAHINETVVQQKFGLIQSQPWVILVEIKYPIKRSIQSEVAMLLTNNGYEKVFFDGLNDYYVSQEHNQIKADLSFPYNIFDNFIYYREHLKELAYQDVLRDLAKLKQRLFSFDESQISPLMEESWPEKVHLFQEGLDELNQEIAKKDDSQVLETKYVADFEQEFSNRKIQIESLQRQLHNLREELSSIYLSKAWKFTRPLSKISQMGKSIFKQPYRLIKKIIAKLVRPDDHEVPRKIKKGVAGESGFADTPPIVFPKRKGQRIMYYYVDHTVNCPVNTGIQRVTRGLSRTLLELGENVVFVKWDSEDNRLILANRTDLQNLSKWAGPLLESAALSQYPKNDEKKTAVKFHDDEEFNWLIVPEVTHITYHAHPVTLDVITHSKAIGLKIGFIFYDATPLRRLELSSMSQNHEIYMSQLLLIDLIVPISKWAEKDIISFLKTHEKVPFSGMPKIATIELPAESIISERRISAVDFDPTRKKILSVGSITTHKNQLSLARAFQKFHELHPEFGYRLILVGNVHPECLPEIDLLLKADVPMEILSGVADEALLSLYNECAFTVFPSVEEGFGLPIYESLWYGKPCICANFGSMNELSLKGGCLTIDTGSVTEIYNALVILSTDVDVYNKLSREAVSRDLPTWKQYGKSFVEIINESVSLKERIGAIYYFVDSTVSYPYNGGVQRVVRALARSLQDIGVHLIPVKWDSNVNRFYSPSKSELDFLSQWNGPAVDKWKEWKEPGLSVGFDWLLVPELISRTGIDMVAMKDYAASNNIRSSIIFYESMPSKMYRSDNQKKDVEHKSYIEKIGKYDLIFPISHFCRTNLLTFINTIDSRVNNIEGKIQAVELPGEFLESKQSFLVRKNSGDSITILSVGTIDSKKNYRLMVQAFLKAKEEIRLNVKLVICGACPFIELASEIENLTANNPEITWIRDANDDTLRHLYEQCDFTIYPSFEEGVGLPILEGLWYAKPCICGNTGAVAEMAKIGGCLTVETNDVNGLAGAIKLLATDSALRMRLAAAAAKINFKTWEAYGEEIALRLVKERSIKISKPHGDLINDAVFYGDFINIKRRPILSICISTYNRSAWLSLSLQNLFRLLPVPSQYIEVVVCDNASSDKTSEIAKSYFFRPDFKYYRNLKNVGMLGNLKVTAHHATGEYIWILGDDDLPKPDSIERIVKIIETHSGVSLIYLNYAYTREDDAQSIASIDNFLNESIPIEPVTVDQIAPVRVLSTKSENFFTAIYCLVFRRDHGLKAYSQNTSGRPFSSLLTACPTTSYVLNFMMNEQAYWVGTPLVVVNLNVSWLQYASIWILERLPEAHDLAEKMGADPAQIDVCKINHVRHLEQALRQICQSDTMGNAHYFSIMRLVNRFKHLRQFKMKTPVLKDMYTRGHSVGAPGFEIDPSIVFKSVD
jgi:glycosyltransferase involved in cell wall biosynthesis